MGRVLRSFHSVDRRLLERDTAVQLRRWRSRHGRSSLTDWEEIPMGH
nr:hypothetical protein [uncultured Selenomonas sp.]